MIEVRCPDGFTATVENPTEELVRQVLQAIGDHGRPEQPRRGRPRLRQVEPEPEEAVQ